MPAVLSIFRDFVKDFQRKTGSPPPDGLVHVLLHREFTERKAVYKTLYQHMWYKNHVGMAKGSRSPTYVYPPEILQVIRQRFLSPAAGAYDYQYKPTSSQAGAAPGVTLLTLQDFLAVEWPSEPACTLCSR